MALRCRAACPHGRGSADAGLQLGAGGWLVRAPRRQRCCRAPAGGGSDQPAYPYNSGDGRNQKATLEHVFGGGGAAGGGGGGVLERVQAPWAVGWQVNERNLMWNDDLKLRLIKRIASQELGVSDADLEARLQALYNLLPDLAARLVKAPPKRVAQLAASTELVAARLLRLRAIFPQANTAEMVNNRLTLLLDDDLDAVAAAAGRLRALLPGLHVDRFVEAFPLVLDVDDFELALEDAKRIMPDAVRSDADVVALLRRNPELIISLQKGKQLICYDQIDNPWS
ncbi:hypothetical protein HT031_002081 [Scenedesmus sp. PABB004]|nr:hypothetical protein HT031_002081 [Scenedesmus sp. PABB004]